MKHRRYWVGGIALLAVAAAVWAAVGTAGAAPAKQHSKKLTNVTLQLKWVTQAQFAGYYAALDKGYYKAAGLNVNIKIGGPSITPELVVKGKQADFGIDWLPNLFATREQNSALVSVAQVFAR